MSGLRDAASLVLIRKSGRDAQVLMGRRHSASPFMPDLYVFPGGAVDAQDATMPAATRLDPVDARRLELAQDSTTPHALGCAAIRELHEETGLHLGDLRDGALLPDLGALTFFFRALTPQDRPIRFDARFFLADAARLRGTWNDFSQRDVELDDLAWLTVDAARQYDLPLVTDMVLAEVAAFLDCGHRRKDVPFFHMGSDIAGTTGFSRLV